MLVLDTTKQSFDVDNIKRLKEDTHFTDGISERWTYVKNKSDLKVNTYLRDILV